MIEVFSGGGRHFARRWPEVLLVVGGTAIVADGALFILAGFQGDPLWTGANTVALVSAGVVRRRRPDLPASLWVVLMFFPLSTLVESTVVFLLDTGAGPSSIAWTNLAGNVLTAVGSAAAVPAIGLFPEGRAESLWQRRIVGAAWTLVLIPVILAFATPTIPLEYYVDAPRFDNPLHVLPFSVPAALSGGSSTGLVGLTISLGMLALRYRRSHPPMRRRMRVLLFPIALLLIALFTSIVLRERAQMITWVLLLGALYSLAPSMTIGILEPDRFNMDLVLRRLIVYGALWLMVAGVFVGAATLVGVAAGTYLPLGWSVAVALVAAMLFQPARTRLESAADRWVFGERTDPGRVIASLGETLAMTFDMDTLLSRMVAALEDGLGLEWARVHLAGLEAEGDGESQVSVPIVLHGERLGVVECGPKKRGSWTDSDRRILATFASQAALAVHNVELTGRLTAHVEQIAASRARLVRAQESERRRIERNIHDGVQQDLVALIGLAGQIRSASPKNTARDLADLQSGLNRVLDDLRDLAKGIHPSLLSDQGLLVAVEALAARHPLPVTVRADPALRSMSLAAEAEGAIYFAVAEALANSLKHSEAKRVEVTLSRHNGSLLTRICDDGIGFDVGLDHGTGLAGLRDRIAALDGKLEVISAPGQGTTVEAEVAVEGLHP